MLCRVWGLAIRLKYGVVKMYLKKRVRKTWKNPHLERGFYSKKFRESLVEQAALTNEEDGFMQGYEDWEDLF